MHRRPRPGDAFVSGIGASALFLFLLHEMYHLADAMVWGLGSDGLREDRAGISVALNRADACMEWCDDGCGR